ncbi:MAG TPA: hypothetical protein VF158_16415 [Longimicrobiales bacterium]
MHRRRDYTPAGYGADYLHNLRWRYRTWYGTGRGGDPFRRGGSFGRGYTRADDLGSGSVEPGPRPRAPTAAPYYGRHPGGYRGREARAPRGRREARALWRGREGHGRRRAGTAARDYGRAYPYFASAAVVEAAQGYPPADTLNPETYPPALGWGVGDYGEEYEPPGVAAQRWPRRPTRRSRRHPAPPRGRSARFRRRSA